MLNELQFLITLFESYITWLVNMSSGGVITCILVMFFVLLAVFEYCDPKEKLLVKQLQQSYLANIELFVFNNVVMSLLSIPSLLILAEHFSDKGLLNYISNPVWKTIFSFLVIDLSLYFLHKASHSFGFLWMLHKVHHNDPYLNVSTAFRVHFLEILIINIMKVMLIVILGIEGTTLLANETIITIFTMLHHSNISFRGEQLLGRLIITPFLHRVHHSTQRNEHDRNYGAVLSIWDRLFGTLAELKPAEVGVKGYSSQDLINLVMCGFTMTDRSSSVQAVNLDVMIAEAAYYKAEKRGFHPGNELRDWLEAKSEIIRLVYGEKQVKSNLIQKWRDWVGVLSDALSDALNGSSRKYPLFRSLIN